MMLQVVHISPAAFVKGVNLNELEEDTLLE